jgi:hypothetical protein
MAILPILGLRRAGGVDRWAPPCPIELVARAGVGFGEIVWAGVGRLCRWS